MRQVYLPVGYAKVDVIDITTQLLLQLVRGASTPAFLIPPLLDTSLMELAPTNQPSHLIPRLKVFQADRTLGLSPLFINTVLLSRDVRKHATRGMAHSICVTGAFTITCTAHTAGALSGQAGRCLRR